MRNCLVQLPASPLPNFVLAYAIRIAGQAIHATVCRLSRETRNEINVSISLRSSGSSALLRGRQFSFSFSFNTPLSRILSIISIVHCSIALLFTLVPLFLCQLLFVLTYFKEQLSSVGVRKNNCLRYPFRRACDISLLARPPAGPSRLPGVLRVVK